MKVFTVKEWAEQLDISYQAAYKKLNQERYNRHTTKINGKTYVYEDILDEEIEFNGEIEEENYTSTEDQPPINSNSTDTQPIFNNNSTHIQPTLNNNSTDTQPQFNINLLLEQLKEKDKQIEALTKVIADQQKAAAEKDKQIAEQINKTTELLAQANELTRNNQILMLNQPIEAEAEAEPKADIIRQSPQEDRQRSTRISKFIKLFSNR